MKTWTSKWWITAGIFLAVGLVFMAFSVGLGALGHGIYIDSRGVHISGRDNTDTTFTESNLDAFTSITVSTRSTDIELIASDHFGFEAHLPHNNDSFEWRLEDGRLTIEAGRHNDSWRIDLFSLNFSSNNAIKIFYPEGAEFADLVFDATSGNITFSDISADSIRARVVSGDIRTERWQSRAVGLHTTSGNITVIDADWQELDAEAVSGNIRLGGTAALRTHAKTTSGNITSTLTGSPEAHVYELEVTSGTIRVGGQRMGSPARSAWPPSGSSDLSEIKFRTTSGNIHLDFRD
ncbi:DUF4097 domain-containing protein [Candidatus Saccharibacteria bacterium]|nr:DUF4097 domain-containing protein [Candidatus Saccharibacteria bacterium]